MFLWGNTIWHRISVPFSIKTCIACTKSSQTQQIAFYNKISLSFPPHIIHKLALIPDHPALFWCLQIGALLPQAPSLQAHGNRLGRPDVYFEQYGIFKITDRVEVSRTWHRSISTPHCTFRLSIISRALVLSISKLMTGSILLIERNSFLLLLLGEWLLLLINLLCICLAFVSNSWLLLIPGTNFLYLTSLSISCSCCVRTGDELLALFGDNVIEEPLCVGDRTGDLMGDRSPFAALDWLMRCWSNTTSSRICASVLSLSAWCSVSIRVRSICPVGLQFTSDLHKTKRSFFNIPHLN